MVSMNALSHEFDLSNATMLPPLDRRAPTARDQANLAAQWDAVHEAAAAIGVLAQLGRPEESEAVAGLPRRAAAKGGYQYDMVLRGVDDLAAVMQPGLRALLALSASGRDTTSAALTLWREFHASRDAIIALAPDC